MPSLVANGHKDLETVQVFTLLTYVSLVCLWFYAVSTVFQLFNGDSSQIHVSWTISNQYLTRHWRASHGAIAIILSANGGKPLLPALKTLVCHGRGSNPQPPSHKADTLITRAPSSYKPM